MLKKSKENWSAEIFNLKIRIQDLEERVFKNKKQKTTLYQSILLLDHLGMLDKIYELDISNVKKADLLATILNTDPSNTKKALEALPKKDTQFRNGINFQMVVDTFEAAGIQKLVTKTNKILKEIDGL